MANNARVWVVLFALITVSACGLHRQPRTTVSTQPTAMSGRDCVFRGQWVTPTSLGP